MPRKDYPQSPRSASEVDRILVDAAKPLTPYEITSDEQASRAMKRYQKIFDDLTRKDSILNASWAKEKMERIETAITNWEASKKDGRSREIGSPVGISKTSGEEVSNDRSE